MATKKKNKNYYQGLLRGIVAILIIAMVIFGLFLLSQNVEVQKDVEIIQSFHGEDQKLWTHIFTTPEPYVFDEVPMGVILPNDHLAAMDVSRIYQGIGKILEPSVVVVIGANSSGEGIGDIQTCLECNYETVVGPLKIDEALVMDLNERKIAEIEEDTFFEESSIFAQTPFIKHFFPRAKMLPIVLSNEIPVEDAIRLREWLDSNLPEDALVIASTNFSEAMTDAVTEFHGLSAKTAINNFDFENIYDIDADSVSSIYVLLSLMEKNGYKRSELMADFNSQKYFSDHNEETSDYQFWAFFEGENDIEEGVSIISMGSMHQDFGLTLDSSWDFHEDRDFENSDEFVDQLKDMPGNEGSFFTGSDFLVFDLEEDQCQERTQNEMVVSFCKFSESDDSSVQREQRAIIREKYKDRDIDLVYLLFDYSGSELTKSRESMTRAFMQNGLDIFVGRGLDGVIPFEYYKTGLIFYSLGDFLTDNKLANELTSNSSGLVLGLYVTPDKYSLYFYPIDIVSGYPKLMDYSERPNFFIDFTAEASISSRRSTTDVMKGVLEIDR